MSSYVAELLYLNGYGVEALHFGSPSTHGSGIAEKHKAEHCYEAPAYRMKFQLINKFKLARNLFISIIGPLNEIILVPSNVWMRKISTHIHPHPIL